MALQPPQLSDLTRDGLRDSLVRRIPIHSPDWTDYSPADPGIALVELFAFLGDDLLYRLNRAPEASKLAFLQLLNVPPYPAQIATAQVKLDLQRGAVEPVTPAFAPTAPRLQLSAGSQVFQPIEEITVLPLELTGWIKKRHTEPLPDADVAGVTQLLKFHLQADPVIDAYEAVAMPAPVGGTLPPPTATSASVDQALWLCLLAPDAVLTALDTGAGLGAALETIRRTLSGRVLNLGVRTDDALCGPTDHWRCPDPGSDPPRWPLLWSISTGNFGGQARRVDRIVYERLSVVADTTSGLTRSGTVRLRLPEKTPDGRPRFGAWTAASFDPPDEDLLGVGGQPPRLDDPKLADRVLAWIRVARVDPMDPPVRLCFIDANMVAVEQAVTASPELLGNGAGRAGLTLQLSKTPVITGTEVIQVRPGSTWENWTRVDDIALAGPDDPFYALDPIAGTVAFGDGVHGRIPLPGQAIRCLAYRYGGGVQGNVGAGAISRVRGQPLRASNPLPATGGQDAEPVAAAQARIPTVLRNRDRAVCAEDFRDIALATPGVQIRRVEVLPRHKPFERADGIPGVVTLIVLPAYDQLTPDTPTPDREMLRRVCAWLEPRRLVTTELYVTPPEYVPVDIAIAVEPEPGTGEETVRNWVELALRQHFAPLPPYGPAGAGWPFGRAVRDRDAEAAALRVEGVQVVNDVVVQGTEMAADGAATDVTGTVLLHAWQLPVLRKVRAALGKVLPSLDPDPPPPSGGIPVPVRKEKC
jgi:Baseplate J-like protein